MIVLNLLIKSKCGKEIYECSNKELYDALLEVTKDLNKTKNKQIDSKKKLYYISAEFLIGKLLANNLINLGIYNDVKTLLAENGKDLCEIEELENEPSLGNGGLGRLAACFLDSIATLNLNGDGVGLNYHLGLFKQVFQNNKQTEAPNNWIEIPNWLTDTGKTYDIQFRDFTVKSRMYDIAVMGYNGHSNNLHLFDIETVDESIVYDQIKYPQWDIMKNLTLFLYPDDSTEDGKKLRLYQQYFMVCNAANLIIEEALAKGSNLYDLNEYAVIQINDTHPSLIIPELVRQLMVKGIDCDKAINIVANICAYTNHTILSEALEKWPIKYIELVCPKEIMNIIKRLDERIAHFGDSTRIIDYKNGIVHMAHMDIHYSYSVNGVAQLHTNILKNVELNNFYKLYPNRFNNKTNGITFRRWLKHSNPELADLLTKYCGDVIGNTSLIENIPLDVLYKLDSIKYHNKVKFCNYIKKTQNIDVNPNSIFDVQVKRLHEYKRQMMNCLYVIYKYQQIKAGNIPSTPITVIFGAKAAPAYEMAKNTIHLILCLQELVNNDPMVNKHLNVIMLENYNVTVAEKLIPACDISEQISLASKEASGTGNMKFMLNGALTLGTEDGANVEIHELVGNDNIFIFGKSSDEVIKLYKTNSYKPYEYYKKHKDIVDFINSEEMRKIGDINVLNAIHYELLSRDFFMSLLDLEDYIQTREKAYETYENKTKWNEMCLINIANSGFFSSDRTIQQYNEDIWKLKN